MRNALSLFALGVLAAGCSKALSPSLPAPSIAPTGEQASQVRKPIAGELVEASVKGDFDRVKDLIERGANVNENVGQVGRDLNPLLAAIAGAHGELALFLIESGASSHASYGGYLAAELSLRVFGPEHPVTVRLGKGI